MPAIAGRPGAWPPRPGSVGFQMVNRLSELFCIAGLAGFAVALTPNARAGAPQRPNFVLIISDDQDYTHFGFMGHKLARTPTLDSLAEAGAVFPVAHLPMSRCRPALASLLCGRHPHQSGVYFNYGSGALSATSSLPSLLKEAGYATFAQGKYWEGDPRRMGFTHGPGYDRGFVRRDQTALFEFLDNVGDRPFFIWYAPLLPHTPHNPPERFRRLFDPGGIPVPPWMTALADEFRRLEATSMAMEAWLDDGVSQLMDKLRQLKLERNTMIIFLVDNGWANGLVSKGSPFEMGLRTPIVLTWPNHIKAGQRLPNLVSALDLMPTILDLAGLPIPESCGGRSLRPLLEGRPVEWRQALLGAIYPAVATPGDERPERDVYALYARTPRWKYILYVQDLRADRNSYFRIKHILTEFPQRNRGDQALYDLEADPFELNDLAARPEHRDRLAAFQRQVLEWWEATGGKPLRGLRPE